MVIEEEPVRMSKNRASIFRIVLFTSLMILFLGFTDPTVLPPVLLLVPFVLLYFLLYELLGAFIIRRKNVKKIGYRKVVAASLSALGVLLLLLSSLNQLSTIDVIVIVTLVTGVFFYIRYADFF